MHFTNTIDTNEEIIEEEDSVNFQLWLTDDAYRRLLDMSGIAKNAVCLITDKVTAEERLEINLHDDFIEIAGSDKIYNQSDNELMINDAFNGIVHDYLISIDATVTVYTKAERPYVSVELTLKDENGGYMCKEFTVSGYEEMSLIDEIHRVSKREHLTIPQLVTEAIKRHKLYYIYRHTFSDIFVTEDDIIATEAMYENNQEIADNMSFDEYTETYGYDTEYGRIRPYTYMEFLKSGMPAVYDAAEKATRVLFRDAENIGNTATWETMTGYMAGRIIDNAESVTDELKFKTNVKSVAVCTEANDAIYKIAHLKY